MLLFPGYAPTVLCSMPAAATKLHGLGFEAQADMLIGCLPISLLPLCARHVCLSVTMHAPLSHP